MSHSEIYLAIQNTTVQQQQQQQQSTMAERPSIPASLAAQMHYIHPSEPPASTLLPSTQLADSTPLQSVANLFRYIDHHATLRQQVTAIKQLLQAMQVPPPPLPPLC